jgi:hypothetical protein
MAASKVLALAERADRKNAILEGVLRSAAEQQDVGDREAVKPVMATAMAGGHGGVATSPAPGQMPPPLGEMSNLSSVDVKTSFATTASSSGAVVAEDPLAPASAMVSVSRRGSSAEVPPPPPGVLGSPKLPSTSFASSSMNESKSPREARSMTSSPQKDAGARSSNTSPQLSNMKTFTEVIKERLEDLAAKVAGEGAPNSGSFAHSPVSPRQTVAALPTADDLLAGTELETTESSFQPRLPSAAAQRRQTSPTQAGGQAALEDAAGTATITTTIPTADVLSPLQHPLQSASSRPHSRLLEAVKTTELNTDHHTVPLSTTNALPQCEGAEPSPPAAVPTAVMTQQHSHSSEKSTKASDRELRLLFEEDPDAFSDVISDLAESAAARIMQEFHGTDDHDLVHRPANPATDVALMDTPPPLSDQLNTYKEYVPARTEDPEALLRERSRAQRLLAEQERLDALVAEIVGQVSRLWPTVQSAPSSRRAEFFQTSMEVAWRAQKKRAINVGKLISMLDRKVSARGWYPRYDHRDELRDGSDDETSSSSSHSENDEENETMLLTYSGGGAATNTLSSSSLIGTQRGGGVGGGSMILHQGLSSTIPSNVGDNTIASAGSGYQQMLSPKATTTLRRKRSTISKRNAGGPMIGRRRGSATTLHRALSEIAHQHRMETATIEHDRAVQKEQQARQIQEHGVEATSGGSGTVVGTKVGSVRFRSHRFMTAAPDGGSSNATAGGQPAPQSGWEEAEGVAMAPLRIPDELLAALGPTPLHAPSAPPSYAGRHRVSFPEAPVGAPDRHYQVIHLPRQPARHTGGTYAASVAVASGRSYKSISGAQNDSALTVLVKSQHHAFEGTSSTGGGTNAQAHAAATTSASFTSLLPWNSSEVERGRLALRPDDEQHEPLPNQLRYGESYPRHLLEELPFIPSAALAHARIQNIRKHRLTYHLSLRTGLIRD